MFILEYEMKLHSLNKEPVRQVEEALCKIREAQEWFSSVQRVDFDDRFLQKIFLEGQLEYLQKSYPDIDSTIIQQAIDFDRKNAEKLVFGLNNGTISNIDLDSLAAVADIDPHAKVSNKSPQDLAYEAAIKQAKSINLDYWQWIIKILKADPDATFDEGLFHYLEGEGHTAGDIKDASLREIQARSDQWHEEQFSNQKTGGDYELELKDSNITAKTGPFYWVQVSSNDAPVEGDKMQNCIGTYCRPSDDVLVFSMRNKFNNPHVSISIKRATRLNRHPGQRTGQLTLREIKGKQNKQPVPKYIPFILEFINTILKDGILGEAILIDKYSDFWNLPIEFDNYIQFGDENLLSQVPSLIDKISDDALNDVVLKKGIVSTKESTIRRLTPETVQWVLEQQSWTSSSNPRQTAGDFISTAIKLRKITEQQGILLAKEGKMTRSALMVLNSVYHPKEFVKAISEVPAEDLVLSFQNYEHGIDGFEGRDPIFSKIIFQLIDKGNDLRERPFLTKIMSKMPIRDLMQVITWYSQHESESASASELINIALHSMGDHLIEGDFETKYSVLSQVPPDSQIDSLLADNIVYSTDLGHLRQIYDLGIKALNKNIIILLRNLRSLPDPQSDQDKLDQSRGDLGYLSGSSEVLLSGASAVLSIDDEEELRALRKSTKSRGVKIMIDRKLARKRRFLDRGGDS